jgi:hypothetical protein
MFKSKKIKVFVLVFTFVVFAIVAIAFKSKYRVKQLGGELLTIETINEWSSNRNSPIDGFVNIGPGLYGILTTHKVPLKDIEVKSEFCDCFNESQYVTHSIKMKSPNGKLCIRLHYDYKLDKYHIVGYTGGIE